MLNLTGYKFIREQLSRIKELRDAVAENKDIEDLHKMRVASRKILSAVYLFENYFRKNMFFEWESKVKKLAKALGKPRDLDVQMLFLDEFMQKHRKESVTLAVGRMKVRLKQRREKLQNRMIKNIDLFLKDISDNPFSKAYDNSKQENEDINADINSLIEKKLSRMKMFEPYIFNIDNVDELHELRKANKLLRYALEIFNPYYGYKLDPFIEQMSAAQDKLGLIHDYDVWQDIIPEFSEKEKVKILKFYGEITPFYSLEPGINYFLEKIKEERIKEYNNFITEWNKLNGENFTGKLLEVIRTEKVLKKPPRKKTVSKPESEKNITTGINPFLDNTIIELPVNK